MNERLKELRKALNISQEKLGEMLGITKSGVSDIESGRRKVTEQHIIMLRNHGVNEKWIRTGEGEMFLKPTKNDQIAAMIADVLVGENEFKKKLIAALASFDESDWEKFEAVLDKVIQGMNGEKEE